MEKLSLSNVVFIVFAFCAAAAIAMPAQTLTTLASFNGNNGSGPTAPLLQGSDGNFYGTTVLGGAHSGGTIFKITPGGTLTTLYSFNGNDGFQPYAGLVRGNDGNFYGTTNGGLHGIGEIFKITPSGALRVLHIFNYDYGDGGYPGPLVLGNDGNLYGLTSLGGGDNAGTFFMVTPDGNTFTTLYTFDFSVGKYPTGPLILLSDGNFYGTAPLGGDGYGTIFKITPSGTPTVLYSFCPQGDCSNGASPNGALVRGSDGNFYGSAGGGTYDGGVIFKLTPSGTLTDLHNFNRTDGLNANGGLVQGRDGNFYGTTSTGGAHGVGTIFQMTPGGRLNSIYSFTGGADGANPKAGVVQGSDGKFYGTTYIGGANNDGTVFSLPTPIFTTTSLTSAPNPSYPGQAVTMTATVTAQNGTTPTGTVVFQSNGASLGSASLNNSGVAVLVYSGLPLGTYSLTAVYQGSATMLGSTSNTVTQVVGFSLTSVTSSPNPSTVGDEVTLTATVSPSGPPAPSGTIRFSSNGTAISGCIAVTLTSDMAVCRTSALAVGTDAVLATYSGDSNYLPSGGTVIQIVNPVPVAVQFVPLTPCRVVDTRNPNGTFGGPAITGQTSRQFPLAQSGNPCNIPASAMAYSLNVTVVPSGRLGYLTIWPTGQGQPSVSLMNSLDGRIKANAAIIPAGTPNGSVTVYVTATTNVVLDIDGYFEASTGSTLEFYPLTPCRVLDTRNPDGHLGGPFLSQGAERDFPVPESSCIPHGVTPAAYSFNITVAPHPAGQRLGFLTVWPAGEQQPTVSTLNNPTGTNVANAAIVPAGTDGAIAVYPNNNTDLIVDINGYFAAPGSGGLSLYTLTPCRVLDTRDNNGQPFQGERTVNVVDSACGPPSTAQAFVFNATVVPPGHLGYLTLWPDGEDQPVVSTLNATDGAITSNMAIVPTNNGSIDAYASALTQLILDISSYFAP